MTLRVALAGAGFASTLHLPGWQRVAGAQVVAICDPDRARAQARARESGVPAVFDDAETMLDATRPDAFDIAAPLAAHLPLCLLAAARGIPTLCQKPLAPSLAEAQALALAVAGRMRLMVHENWRFRPQYRLIKRWLDAGDLGRPVSCVMQMRASGLLHDARGIRPQLERQPFFAQLERLLIAEALIHHLDVLRWLLGPLSVTAARTGRLCPDVRGEDHAVIFLEGRDAWAVLDGNYSAPDAPPTPADRLELTGTRGVALFEGRRASLSGRRSESVEFDLDAAYRDSYAGAISHFAASLAAGTEFETDMQDNLHTMKLVEEAYGCARAQRDP